MTAEDEVKKILVEKFGLREDEIFPESDFSNDLFFREEDIDDLVDCLEEYLERQIGREDIATVRDLVERIEDNG